MNTGEFQKTADETLEKIKVRNILPEACNKFFQAEISTIDGWTESVTGFDDVKGSFNFEPAVTSLIIDHRVHKAKGREFHISFSS